MSTTTRMAALLALGTFGFVACTDTATAPTGTVSAAALFDQAAAEAVTGGDAAGAAGLTFVAKALRNGVRPTPFEAYTAGKWEAYEGLVMVEEHVGVEPMTHGRLDRNFYMWHTVGEANLHLMTVKTSAEHGHMDVGNPDPGAGAYKEVARNTKNWDAFRGWALVVEKGVAGPCERETPLPNTVHRVTCNIAEYEVSFELSYKRLFEATTTTPWIMWARPRVVNGLKWTVYDLE